MVAVSGGGCAHAGFFDERVPDGIIHKKEMVARVSPPEGFTKVVAWAHTVTYSKDTKSNAVVYVDYLRLIKVVNGQCSIVEEDRYTGTGPLPAERGGIYDREPRWFANNDHHIPMTNSQIIDDKLVIFVSETPKGIPHWWTKRVDVDPRAQYFVEIKYKIIGEAAVQVGVDFWKDGVAPHNGWEKDCIGTNNCEAFVSKPLGPTGNKWAEVKIPM